MSDLKILERNAFLPKENKMKKIILLIALTLGALQADNVVAYDTRDTAEPQVQKPNYPNNDIHFVR